MDNLEKREKIILKAMSLKQSDPEDIDALDRMLCAALGIDQDENPPLFIFDALAAS